MSAAKSVLIRSNFPRPPADAVKRLCALSTCVVSDALGKSGGLHHSIHARTSRKRFAGPALTVRCWPRDNFAPWVALDIVRSGDVLVISADASAECAILGDHFVGMARKHGISGIVTDGLIRDIPGIEELGVPVFARGIVPNSSEKLGRGEVGLPVCLAGTPIEPGDVVCADENGVVIVPHLRIEETLASLERVQQREAATDQLVQGPATMPPWLEEALAGPAVRRI